LRLISTTLKNGGPSLLESQSVSRATSLDYAKRLNEFVTFCAALGVALGTDEEIEMGLLEFFDSAYLSGKPLDHGTKLLAAVGWHWPRLHRCTRSGKLPRARRALQGWGRVAPLLTRLPLPWPVVVLIATALALRRRPDLALGVLVAADCYLRPGQLLSLRGSSVVPAQPHLGNAFRHTALLLFPRTEVDSSKRNEFDDSVVMDSAGRKWISVALERLAQERPQNELLFAISDLKFRLLFQTMADAVGFAHLDCSPHVLRHVGPSHDHLVKARPLEEIRRRGGWSSLASVSRYEKSSQVTAQLAGLPSAVKALIVLAEGEAQSIIGLRRTCSCRLKSQIELVSPGFFALP